MKIKNIDKAAERIKQAVENKERIILYGDSDLDGISSVVILEEGIKNLGGEVCAVVFPNREDDGYGINLKALEFLREKAPALFITLDLGIGNVKEVEIANKMGFEVIIVDHHQILDKIPDAKIIINPNQEGDNYSFKDLCNAGLTFKLAEEILGDPISDNLRNSFLELVALATIADMVPQVDENKTFIEEGLRSLKNTFRPGLKAFLDILGIGEVLAGKFTKIISALNAAESTSFSAEGVSSPKANAPLEHASGGKNESYELLTSPSVQKCRELAEKLITKTQYKQQKIQEITEEVERRISSRLQDPDKVEDSRQSRNNRGSAIESGQNPNEAIIFEGDPAWKLLLAGPVASIIASKYQKPTFIFKRGDEESCGSVRSLKEGRNSVEAMKFCSDILITYGGHPKAAGFRIKTENLEKFRERLNDYFKK